MSCNSNDDDNDNKPLPEPNNNGALKLQTVTTNAKEYGKWTYYSIEKGKEVQISDFKNSLDWDIAFHRDHVRLNGGKSGKGKGEAIKLNEEDINKVTVAPTEGYVKDTEGFILTKLQFPQPIFTKEPFNKEVKWLDIDTSNPPPVYTMEKDVLFVIKTASGKYAKIKFLDYLGDRGEKIIIKWQYAFQKDGSTNLK